MAMDDLRVALFLLSNDTNIITTMDDLRVALLILCLVLTNANKLTIHGNDDPALLEICILIEDGCDLALSKGIVNHNGEGGGPRSQSTPFKYQVNHT